MMLKDVMTEFTP